MDNDPASYGEASAGVIDGEHQVQTAMLRALGDALRSSRDATQVRALLEQLIAYSDVHFMSEQLLMRMCSYPDYDDHVLDHDRTMETLRGMASRHAASDGALAPGEMDELTQFLLRHIATRDRRFTAYYLDWTRMAGDSAAKAPESAP